MGTTTTTTTTTSGRPTTSVPPQSPSSSSSNRGYAAGWGWGWGCDGHPALVGAAASETFTRPQSPLRHGCSQGLVRSLLWLFWLLLLLLLFFFFFFFLLFVFWRRFTIPVSFEWLYGSSVTSLLLVWFFRLSATSCLRRVASRITRAAY